MNPFFAPILAVARAELPPSHRATHYGPTDKPHPPHWPVYEDRSPGQTAAGGILGSSPAAAFSIIDISEPFSPHDRQDEKPWFHPIRTQLWTSQLSLGNNKMLKSSVIG